MSQPYGVRPSESNGPTDWADRSTWTPGNPPLDANGEPDRSDERVRKSFSTTMQHRTPSGRVVTINLPAPPEEA